MTNKDTIYIGLNDKDSKKQLIKNKQAMELVNSVVLRYADGCSLYSGKGTYKHNDNSIVKENSLQLILYGVLEETVRSICNEVKAVLNQESVIWQSEVVNSVFV